MININSTTAIYNYNVIIFQLYFVYLKDYT
jgi:hypothetical protein